jgi:phage terminase large subunit-like protein
MTGSYLWEYIGRVESGEEVAGLEIKATCELLKEHFSDHSIRINLEAAHKRIRFIEEKCKLYEAPFAGKPFKLALFQKAIIESLFAFEIYDFELDRHVRKYQDLLLMIGRKNGKSPFAAAIGLAEFFCGPEGIKVLAASNDYDQADIVFQAINAMREESKSLEKVTRKNIKGIYFGHMKNKKTNGKFSHRNKGNIRKISAKTGAKEGRNVGVVIVDEVHELKDNELIMPLRQALSTQDEPLYIEITTEGFITDGYLDDRLIEARRVLKREMDRPRWLIWLFTQDSENEIYEDENSWSKSNPGMGVIKKWSYLRNFMEEARTNKVTRAFILAKDFNIKQNNAQAWLMETEFTNHTKVPIEHFRGAMGIGGVDLAETTDLCCAKALIIRPDDNRKYFLTKYFIPEAKIALGEEEDKKNYLEWARLGLIEVTPGNENDFAKITQWYVWLYKSLGIRMYKIGYDNALAKYWVKEMEEIGFDMERIPQKPEELSNPMKLLESDFKASMVVYDDNPIDRWCLSNTAMKIDGYGRIMPMKIKDIKNRRIDGSAAKIIAYATYLRNRNDYLNIVR